MLMNKRLRSVVTRLTGRGRSIGAAAVASLVAISIGVLWQGRQPSSPPLVPQAGSLPRDLRLVVKAREVKPPIPIEEARTTLRVALARRGFRVMNARVSGLTAGATLTADIGAWPAHRWLPLHPQDTDISLSLAPSATAAGWQVQLVNHCSSAPKLHGRLWAEEEEASTHSHKIVLAIAGFVAMGGFAWYTNWTCQRFPDQQIEALLDQLHRTESVP